LGKGQPLKNWTPKRVVSFLTRKKRGFEKLKNNRGKGDHCCLYNKETEAYTEVDMGRKSFSAREMLTFVNQTKIPKEEWLKGK